MAIERMPARPTDEHERGNSQKRRLVDDEAECEHGDERRRNRRRVSECNGNER
jgi:hypothetical protein